MDHIKLGCQNIKISTFPIRNFHVIFYHMIHFYFFNTLIDSKPVTFMDNIISDFQISKITDLLAFVFFDFLFLRLLFTENITLRNDGKFQMRIFKSFLNLSV